MYFQFLIEDQSGGVLIDTLMKKVAETNENVIYDCKSFRGIGGFTKKNTVKETRTGKLLNDLATYLKGFNRSLRGIDAAIFVVLDCDDRDAKEFRIQLQEVAQRNGISIDCVFCIAIEEMEAWLLGDHAALQMAYPSVKQQVLRSYVQDSICGTWEILAEAIYPGGLRKLRTDCPTYIEIGAVKAEWMKNIGSHMDLNDNQSPSFQFFISEINRRIREVA